MGSLPRFQFDRAFVRSLDGMETQEDIEYVAKNIGKHEKVIEKSEIVIITTVDITRQADEPTNPNIKSASHEIAA